MRIKYREVRKILPTSDPSSSKIDLHALEAKGLESNVMESMALVSDD